MINFNIPETKKDVPERYLHRKTDHDVALLVKYIDPATDTSVDPEFLNKVALIRGPGMVVKYEFGEKDSSKGRGKPKRYNKNFKLIDESYNSNPLSLNFSIKKFDNLKVNPNKKFMLLGDMLELGKFSKKLHIEAAKDINKAKFKKLFVYGNYITETFNKIRTQKRGKILKSTSEILNIIKNDLNNGDFLMIKGSNSTGLNQITKQIGSKS